MLWLKTMHYRAVPADWSAFCQYPNHGTFEDQHVTEERVMLSRQLRFAVVETDGGDDVGRPQRRGYRELLPWADPYIAQLMLKHLLQAGDAAALSCEAAGE
jgi:hypothetical protein